MVSPEVRRFAQELEQLRETVERSFSTPQLDRSSIEDGALHENDASGQLVQIIGKQWDGTHLAAPIAGPPPPAATGITMHGVVGGIKVGWAGLFADDALVPMDFARTEIHVDTTPPEPGHEAMFSSLRTTINTSRGGETLIALPDGEYYAWLIVRSAAGKASPASEVVGPVSPAKVGIDDLGFDVSQFGGGTTVHYGPDDPSDDTDLELKTGDLWFREVAPGPPPEYETSRWVDGGWTVLQDQSVGEALAKAIAAEQAVATKASIFTRPDDPSLDAGVTVTVGDIWMDSDDGNRLRTWGGTEWQDRQLGSGAIKPNSLVASDVLATGTVSASLLEAVLVLASDVIGGDPQGAHVVLNEEGLTGYRADGTITLDFDTETGDVRMIGELSTGYVGQPRVEIKRDAAGGEHRIAFHGINETPGVDRTRIYAFDLYDYEYDVTVTALSLETFTDALWGRVYATHGSVGMEASETIWDEEMGRHYPAKTLSMLSLYESTASLEGKEFVWIGTSNPQVSASADGSHEGTRTEWFTPMHGHPLETQPRISHYIGQFNEQGIQTDYVEALRLTASRATFGIPLTAEKGVNSHLSISSFNNNTPVGSYPIGSSLLYVASTDVAAGGWPFTGKSGTIHSIKRPIGTQVTQRWQRAGSPGAIPEMWIRHGDSGGWSNWVPVYEDTGWVNCTINPGFAMLNAEERPQVRRFNGKVYMRGAWASTGITANGVHSVGKIPAGFIPPLNVIGPIGTALAAQMSIGFVSAAGDIQIRANSAVSAYYMFNPMEWFTN